MSCVVCSAAEHDELQSNNEQCGDGRLTFHVRRLQKNGPDMVLTNELPDLRSDHRALEAHLMEQ